MNADQEIEGKVMLGEAQKKELHEAFIRLRDNELALGQTTAKQRIARLRKLEAVVTAWRPRIKSALFEDHKKSGFNVDAVDIYPVVSSSRYARRHLRNWMHPHRVTTPIAFIGANSYIKYESKGVSLIVSPWNYPISMTLCPLVAAVAAGCPIAIKTSEFTPKTSVVMREMLSEIFPANEVFVADSSIAVATELLAKPFRHIHFTGSSRVGKIIMAAAAKNLASVTLELGGKSPIVVDKSANISRAARRIVQTKWANAGQSCVAPDYVLAHADVYDQLVSEMKQRLDSVYGENSDTYTGIINQGHVKRLRSLCDEAVTAGTNIWQMDLEKGEGYFPPTIATDVTVEREMMKEEIFGPILPVLRFSEIGEAIDTINGLPRPLTLGFFGNNKGNQAAVINSTRAGGSAINHAAVHFFNHNLPFGGVNNSGTGKAQGEYGFQEFSNARSILKQNWPFSPHEWLSAPLNKGKDMLIDFMIKWL